MPLSGSSPQQSVVGSEPNTVPLCAGPQHVPVHQVSVRNTFNEVGPKSPSSVQGSITAANVSASSSSDSTSPVPENLCLPVNLSNAIAIDVPQTPSMGVLGRSPMDAYFDPGCAQSPMSRWYDGTPSKASEMGCVGASHLGAAQSPLARWLQGSPASQETNHADVLKNSLAAAVEPECFAPGQMYFTPFGQPMMWQTAPMMTGAMRPSVPNVQPTLQTMVQPTVVLVPQPSMPVRPHQSNAESLSRDSAAPAATGVWEGMAAWKAGQFGGDREWKGKEAKSQLASYNQNSVRPRGRNAISKKLVDKPDSVGPRAVFVDLSKIIPTGLVE